MSGAVLVTGATGFVGRNVVNALLERGKRVVGFSANPVAGLSPPPIDGAMGRLLEITGDVCDREHLVSVLCAHEVDEVIHLAAMTPGADEEAAVAQTALDVNVGGTAALIQAAIAVGAKKFVFASSVAVYGGGHPDGCRLDEELRPDPQTLYAISKHASERVVARLGAQAGLDWRIGRLGRVFGPYEYETGVRATMSQIFVATQAARAGRRVRFVRPCFKAWHYAPDAANALVMLLDAKDAPARIYNLGGPDVWALSHWCRLLGDAFPGFGFEVGAPGAQGDDSIEIDLNGGADGGNLSFERFEREIGTMPSRSLKAAFEAYVMPASVSASRTVLS